MVSASRWGEIEADRGVAPDGVDRELAPDEPVPDEAVADDAVDPLDAGLPQGRRSTARPGSGRSLRLSSVCSSSAMDSFALRAVSGISASGHPGLLLAGVPPFPVAGRRTGGWRRRQPDRQPQSCHAVSPGNPCPMPVSGDVAHCGPTSDAR
jgi:hypothetical protein